MKSWLSTICGFGAALQFDHDAHAVAVALVANIADIVDHLVVHQFGNAFNQLRLVDLVGNLGDDDRVLVLREVLDRSLGAHHEAPAPGAIGFGNAAASVDEAGCREIRSLHVLQQVSQRGVRIVHQRDAAVHDLRQIVRGNVGRHADGDAVRSVHQQVGNSGRQHHRLDRGVVEVGDEIDGVLVDVSQQLFSDFGEARFGVPISRRGIAIDRTKVALAINQRIAQADKAEPDAPWRRRPRCRRAGDTSSDTSPTTPAHFMCLRLCSTPMSCIAYKMRRCTGFSPSRTSGKARPMMTDIE